MFFLKMIWSFVSRFRNYDRLKFFRKFSWILKKEEKHCNSENIDDSRKVQWQIYCKNSSSFFEAVQFKEIGHSILHPAFQRFETMLSTPIRILLKTYLSYPFGLASTRRSRCRSPKTKLFENALQSGSFRKRCFHVVVWMGENGAFRKHWRHSIDLWRIRSYARIFGDHALQGHFDCLFFYRSSNNKV